MTLTNMTLSGLVQSVYECELDSLDSEDEKKDLNFRKRYQNSVS